MRKPFIVYTLVLLATLCACFQCLAQTQKIDPAALSAALCDGPFKLQGNGKCGLPQGTLAKSLDVNDCKDVPGLAVEAGECVLKDSEIRAPRCNGDVANLGFDAASQTCKLEVGKPSSALGDYLGDCFRIVAAPAGTSLAAGVTYAVTKQENIANDDKRLTLLEADLSYWPSPWHWGCRAKSGRTIKPLTADASNLATHGARREGWAYGALAMPYKYYPGAKKFIAGLPVGAYLGWRWGASGSGMTVAAALTLSQVKADTLDPKVKDADGKSAVIGEADVSALSAAFGAVFDINKSGAGKPFKAGLFVGQDKVNTSPTIGYPYKGKWWVAVQLGFDFTDR
jgi:hypothetical protein